MDRNNRQPRKNNHPTSVKLLQRPDNWPGAFADASVDAFLMFDENLNLVNINPAGEKLLGVSREADIGKNITDIVPDIRKTGRHEKYLSVIETGRSFFADDIIPHPRFGDKHLSIKAFKVWHGVGMIVNDITESKLVEEALEHSEKYFRALTENASDAVAVVSSEGIISYESLSFKHMLGYELEDRKGKNSFELVHPDDLPKAVNLFTQLSQNPGDKVRTEIRGRHRDGSWRTLEVVGRSLLNDPAVAGVVAYFSDITEQRRMEEALRESELLATATIEVMSDAVMLVGMDGKVSYVNKAFEKILGYGIEELAATYAVELPTYGGSKDKKKARQALKKVIEKGSAEPIDMIALSKDGMEIPINFTASVVKDAKGNPKMLVAVIRDVTERRKAEEALRQSEEYFRALMENSLDAITIMNEDGTIRYESPSYERLLGFKPEDRVGSNLFERIHPDDITRVAELFAGFLLNRGGTLHTEVRARHKDGSWRHIEAMGQNLLDNPIVKGIVVNLRDITERKKAEEALRESEAKLKLYLDNSPDAIYILDAMGNFLYGNIAAEKAVGYSREEILGRSFVELSLLSDEQLLKAAQLHELNLAGKPTGPQEYELTRKDGSRVFVEISTYPVGKGDNLEVIGIARDITERKRMEEALQQSQLNYRVLFDSTIDGLFVVDSETMKVVLANESGMRMAEIYGFDSLTDLNIADMVEFFHPEDRDRVIKTIAEDMFEKDLREINEFRMLTKDGREMWISAVGTRTKYQGKLAGLVSMRDITEHKQMEEELRRLSDAVKMTSESIAIADLKGRIVDINEAGLRMYGLDDRADLVGKNPFDIIVPEDQPKALENMSKIVETGSVKGIEYHIMRKDGKKALIETSVSLINGGKGEPKGIVAVARDITERKRMEEALRESEARYRLLVDNAQDIVFRFSTDKGLEYVSPAVSTIMGYSPEELRGNPELALGLATAKDQKLAMDYQKVISEGISMRTREIAAIRKDGKQVYLDMRSKAVRDRDGNVVAFEGILRDITERKLMEEALRISEERYRLLVENANEAILVAQDGMLRFFNTRVIEILGYSREELASKPFTAFIHSEDQAMVVGRYMARLEGKEVPPVYSFRVVDKTGNARWVEISAVVFMWEGRPATLNFLTDITERKKAEEEKQRMEEQLHLAAQLAAVGELAAGVAHELNNPLAIIQMYSESSKERGDLDDTAKKDLLVIHEQAERASKIIRNLLSFARKHEPEKNMVSVNEIIEKTLEMHSHQLSINNIEVSEELQPGLPMIMADYNQMQQVFMNIIINAEQAMLEAHGRGKLNIKTETTEGMIKISFTDDGPGISEGNLKRIFDPFFTTKEVGKGTGLGLSICYGIVQAHGGHIYAISKMGEGATFVIEIPITSEY